MNDHRIPEAPEAGEEIDRLLPPATVVVSVDGKSPKATGWLISRRGYIFTAGHVLEEDARSHNLADKAYICFDWKESRRKGPAPRWIATHIIKVEYNHEDFLGLDYAILRISETDESLLSSRHPLPVYIGRIDTFNKQASVYGLEESLRQMQMVHNVNISGFESGNDNIRATNPSLLKGYSGAPIYLHQNRAVAATAKVARENTSERYIQPLRQVIDDWPPLEDIILLG